MKTYEQYLNNVSMELYNTSFDELSVYPTRVYEYFCYEKGKSFGPFNSIEEIPKEMKNVEFVLINEKQINEIKDKVNSVYKEAESRILNDLQKENDHMTMEQVKKLWYFCCEDSSDRSYAMTIFDEISSIFS